MVSSTLVDLLTSPTLVLQQLYNRVASENTSVDFPSIVSSHFSSLFPDDDSLNQISLLDTSHRPDRYPPSSLVRFRAMIQDTSCSPELYLPSINGSCAGWGFEGELPADEINMSDLKERYIIYAVSIPGEAAWCFGGSRNYSPSINYILRSKQHRFPIPGSQHIVVQLKIYDSSSERLKPTELHDFVGILTFEATSDGEQQVVPTLHVLFQNTIPKTLIHRPYPSSSYSTDIREAFISWIAEEALGYDKVAAEWILLYSVASVRSHNPPIFPPALTLSELPPPPSNADVLTISYMLSEILPLLQTFPLSIETLNNISFEPESNEDSLYSGVLQLPPGSTLLLTEIGMEEGILSETGLRSVRALQEVTKSQSLRYNFPFSEFMFPTDITVVVATDAKKSVFLETDIVVPVRAGSSDLYKDRDKIVMPPPELLSAFRELILSAKGGTMSVSDDISQFIQADFVRERQLDQTVTPDDLVRQMSIARLVTISRHETELTRDIWKEAKELDNQRRRRI